MTLAVRPAARAPLALCLVVAIGAHARAGDLPSALWGACGELWSADGRLPDFSFAGYRSGEAPIPDVPAVADVTRYGAVGDDEADDTDAFRRAIAEAPPGAIVVPPGRYRISDVLEIRRSGVVLRGAGPDRSILEFTKDLEDVRPNPGATTTGKPTSNYSWSGGFVWVFGRSGGRALATVVAPARRGDRTIRVDRPGAFRPGQAVRIALADDDRGTLIDHLYAGDPGPTGQLRAGSRRTDQVARVTAVAGDALTLDRALGTDVRASWAPTVHAFEPTVTGVGIEGLGFRFRDRPYAGHFTERGANAIALGDVADCWVRDLAIHDADSGIFLGGRFCTVERVRFTSDRARDGRRRSAGHHGIQASGDDNLIRDFEFRTRFVHDLTVSRCHGNVFSRGRGEDLSLDHHKYAPYANLFTDLDAGAGTQLWVCGGGADLGRHCGAWGTFWNIRAARPLGWPPPGFGPDRLNLVGLTTRSPGVLDPDGRWFEPIPPADLRPADLWAAQLARRLAGTGSAAPLKRTDPPADRSK